MALRLSITPRVVRLRDDGHHDNGGRERGREWWLRRVRVLVGTRKGAFPLPSEGKRTSWGVRGPHVGGWEISHMKASPADPNRIYASQSSSWFGQVIQRSNDGGKTWEP